MNNFCSVGTQVMVFFLLLFLFDQCPGEAIEKSENSFEMIIGFIICYAEHGLIQCDFNEFNY
jgi:RIO-like serine/threonine protein kinase